MNAAQNGNIFGLPNNNSINNQNTNFNQNFMNQNMMMGNQNMMMGNQNMMMAFQNMMMGNPNMMMAFQNMMRAYLNMMMGNQNMMMGNQNCLNNQNNNMGFNNMNGINMNNTKINSNINNEVNKKDDFNIHDKEEIFPINKEISTDVKPNGDIINILFELSIQIYGNKNSTFKEMAKKLCQKINLDEKYINGRIKCIFSGHLVDLDSSSTLKEAKFGFYPTLQVFDDDNVVGT